MRGRILFAMAAPIALLACSTLLGLTDPALDNSIGSDSAAGDVVPTGDSAAEATVSCPGVDVTSDSKNCGVCAHDCLGGACTASTCQPVLVLNDLTMAPRYMVEDSTTLYFSNARTDIQISSVAKVSKTAIDGSTPPQLLGTFGDPGGGNTKIIYPSQVALADTNLYVALNAEEYAGNDFLGGIAQCDITTGCPGTGADDLFISNINSNAVSVSIEDLIYGYEDLRDGGVDSIHYALDSQLLVGADASTLGPLSSNANFILIDSNSEIFAATDDGIYTTNFVGTVKPKVTPIEADQLAIFNDVIYFSSAPVSADGGVNPPASVQSIPTSGGTPTVLASGKFLSVPAGIAVDLNYLYIADQGDLTEPSDGHVYRCPLAGCGKDGGAATVLSTGASSGNNPRTIVAGDKDAIYWGNRYGQIWKLAK